MFDSHKMIQTLINQLYRFPKSKFIRIKRFGGFSSYIKMMNRQNEMEEASKSLPVIPSFSNGLPIYFLTGQKYLYQTLFCAFSLIKHSNENFQFILVDDGSFDQKLIERVNKQMPESKIITAKEIAANLDSLLPKEKFPYLHHKRKVYPHIKKLTDIHTADSQPYKLVLDSDMLFWSNPFELINWLKNPSGSLHLLDSDDSYGYTKILMESLCKAKVPRLVNVGVIGINSNTIDWLALEYWIKTLEDKEGSSYFLEQALSAMIIADQERTLLNPKTYIVNPKDNIEQKNILGHYVDLSKKNYFLKAWKQIIR